MGNEITNKNSLSVRQQIQGWFAGEQGTLLLEEEKKKLSQEAVRLIWLSYPAGWEHWWPAFS